MTFAASNAFKLQLEVALSAGLILAVLGWGWRKVSRLGRDAIDTIGDVKGLLVTDENGMGVIDRLDSIDALIAARTPIFDEVRRQVAELVEQSGIIVDRTETLTPNGGGSMHDQLGRLDATNTSIHPPVKVPAKKAPAKRAPTRRRSQ